jgi:hypothetical protein
MNAQDFEFGPHYRELRPVYEDLVEGAAVDVP